MGRSLWVWGRRRTPRSAETPQVAPGGFRPPLPTLGVTLGKLLGVLEALVAPQERERTQRLVREFGAPGGEGQRLHERLSRTPPAPPRLPEWPWGSSERLPLPVHTSAGLVLPRLDWEDWRGQLWFAARLLSGVLDYREQLQRRDPPQPWIQAAFGGCRFPGPHRDEVLRVPPGGQNPLSVTVSANGQFFHLDLSAPPAPPLPLLAALGSLRGRAWGGGANAQPPVGLLTGQQRRQWGRVRAAMMRDRLNRSSISKIQRSLLLLCLDSPVLAPPSGRGLEGVAAQVLHGGGANANSANRWWDKTLQLVIGQDGTCGALFDPAVIDGAVVAELLDHALEHSRHLGPAPSWAHLATPPAKPQRLKFSISPEVMPEVERARRHLDSLAADVDLHCFSHAGFGEGEEPRLEALLQVALQVAFYRAHGSLCATCEPLSLRQVLPGCTDLLRPPGQHCLALAKALQDPEEQPEVLLTLLREAVEAQESRAREVLSGQGAERHLQGLRQAALSAGEALPEIFLDPAFAQASHFRLCTLQARSREGSWLLRGPLVPDGYGVGVGHVTSQNPAGHVTPRDAQNSGSLRIAVTSFTCCSQTDSAHLGASIRGVLDRLGELLRGRSLT